MNFELSNQQREYFGLDPIEADWEAIPLNVQKRSDGILFFDGDRIKRHIISDGHRYFECRYDEQTRDRKLLEPKTHKDKPLKVSYSNLEKRKPSGVYLDISKEWGLKIGNFTTQTTFYSSLWDNRLLPSALNISDVVENFIENSSEDHLKQIEKFKLARRKHVRFNSGDYFCFKISRTQYGFGRILLDIDKIKRNRLLPEHHGLRTIMGKPVLVQFFAYVSSQPDIDVSFLDSFDALPSDLMMDNLIHYGEYSIIGSRQIEENEFEFPISYGEAIDRRKIVFLQWGMIHKEMPVSSFNKYLVEDNQLLPLDHPSRKISNPYGYYSIGFSSRYDAIDLNNTIANNGIFDYGKSNHYGSHFDLRNPKNDTKRREIFEAFGLDPDASYEHNCTLTKTPRVTDIVRLLET